MTRRLAPLAVGAAVMLIATTVATLARPTEDAALAAPELSNAIVRADPTTVELPIPTTVPELLPTTVAPSSPVPPSPAPSAEAPATTRRPAATTQATQRAQENRSSAPASSGDGRQAASAQGWTLVDRDEFNGSMSPKWGAYDGEGHAGNGRRTPDAVSVENGSLVIRGDADGNTGGVAWSDDQRFGKWEMRARFPRGDDQYHPVLILWPETGGSGNGETDFAETTSASDDVSFFLHYGSEQEYAHKTLDITQWHNYAVEWVDGRVTGYIDGEKWFESTAEETLPPGKLHATIQLDYFPDGGSPEPTEMYVDYMRIYR